jgi:hypothetical protein
MRKAHSLSPLYGYHGCDREIAERVVNQGERLKPSENDYDWLGSGVYFWVDSPERAWDWALFMQKRGKIREPAVIGAHILPSLCLNLTDYGVRDELLEAFGVAEVGAMILGESLPVNSSLAHGISLQRRLDCMVIQTLHGLREERGLPAYDSVYGVFEEGAPLYTGSGFKSKTHVQIAIRSLDCIVGSFHAPQP